MAEHLSSEQKAAGLSPVWSTSSYQEIPGLNPGQDSLSCWPNGKAPDYGCFLYRSPFLQLDMLEVLKCF